MKLDHIGIAVRSIEDRIKIWASFGLKVEKFAKVDYRKVKVAVLSEGSCGDAGSVKIELIEPIGEDSPIAKFLEKKGEGLHHLCFEVKDIEKVLTELKSKGIKLIDEVPSKGAFTKKVAFLHPSAVHGVLIELCEK
ncbi:MAG: methylmalonyl-CoA epimerase [bacterium]|nr:methylmalonyl-CoA epimerase [bacterium]